MHDQSSFLLRTAAHVSLKMYFGAVLMALGWIFSSNHFFGDQIHWTLICYHLIHSFSWKGPGWPGSSCSLTRGVLGDQHPLARYPSAGWFGVQNASSWLVWELPWASRFLSHCWKDETIIKHVLKSAVLRYSRKVLKDQLMVVGGLDSRIPLWKGLLRRIPRIPNHQPKHQFTIRLNKQQTIQVSESAASGTQGGGRTIEGFRPWICVVSYGPKLRDISWKAILKGNGILGACFPDVERRCLANSCVWKV